MDAGPPETDTHDRAHTHELHSNPSPAPTPASLHSSHTQPPHPSVETTQSQGVLPSGSRPVTAASTISACAVMSEEKVEEERENNGGAAESGAEMRVASSEPVVDARQLAQMQKGVEAEQNDGNGSKVDEDVPQLPQTSLTFLLISGRRKTMTFEPDMAVGRVKELVWNAWPAGMFVAPVLPNQSRSARWTAYRATFSLKYIVLQNGKTNALPHHLTSVFSTWVKFCKTRILYAVRVPVATFTVLSHFVRPNNYPP